MIDTVFAVVFLALLVIGAGWPWIKPALQYVRSKFALGTQVLTWSAPNPKASGAMLTFYGVELGRFFVGALTSQEAFVDAPDEKPEPSRIVMP